MSQSAGKLVNFRHEALLYAGRDDFVAQALPFIEAGIESGQPVLVAVTEANADALKRCFSGSDAELEFIEMERLGRNPARIIPAWREFVDRHGGSARGLRGIGEPIWAGRSEAELAECRHHEQLLNIAFADAHGFWLLCPYDTETLDGDLIEAACCSHPHLAQGGSTRSSDRFTLPVEVEQPLAEPLPPAPIEARELRFDADRLCDLRRVVDSAAGAAGLSAIRAADLVVAVNELASNSVRHAGGHGRLRIWQDVTAVACEVADDGRIESALLGRTRPDHALTGGRGLWLVNQLCDLVQVRRTATGNLVRIYMER